MNHPEYWRSTAWFGIVASILLVLMLFGAALTESEAYQDGNVPSGGLTAVLITATIPDTLTLLFLLGFTLITIPSGDVFARQFLFILNGAGYTFTLLGNILITVNLEAVNEPGLEQMINGSYQLAHLLYGLLIAVYVYKWTAVLPSHVRWMAVIAFCSQFALALFYTETEGTGAIQTLLNITTAIWITLTSAYLLIAHQQYTLRTKEAAPIVPKPVI